MTIYPAILTESVTTLEELLSRLRSIHQEIVAYQIDILDGEYADNLTVSPIDLIGVDFQDVPVDFHLMVNDPTNYVYECKQVDNARGIIAQIEHMGSQAEFIGEVEQYGLKPGFALDLYTPISSIDDECWKSLYAVQIMGNQAGFSGQQFKGQIVLDKIAQVAEKKKKLNLSQLEILVDIGMNEETVPQVAKAGATGVAVTSALWQSEDSVDQFHALQAIAE